MNRFGFEILISTVVFAFFVFFCFLILILRKEFKQHKVFQQQLNSQIELENKRLFFLEEKVVLSDRLTQSMQNNVFSICKELLQVIKNA